jgi:hypothetical protein
LESRRADQPADIRALIGEIPRHHQDVADITAGAVECREDTILYRVLEGGEHANLDELISGIATIARHQLIDVGDVINGARWCSESHRSQYQGEERNRMPHGLPLQLIVR